MERSEPLAHEDLRVDDWLVALRDLHYAQMYELDDETGYRREKPDPFVRDVALVPADIEHMSLEATQNHFPPVTNAERLADLPNLRELHAFGADDAFLRIVGQCRALRALSLHWLGTRTLDALVASRALELETLIIDSGNLESLDAVAYLPRLRRLAIIDAEHVARIDALGSLPQLEVLVIRIDRWAHREWAIDSLAPLAGARALRTLQVSPHVRDQRLHALHALPLTLVRITDRFPVEERGAFAGAHPHLADDVPALRRAHWQERCKRCNADGQLARTDVDAPSPSPSPSLCRACDATTVMEIEERWARARDAVTTARGDAR